MPPGGAEVDAAILFVDVRGSTALGERLGASAFAALLNRFYKAATDALLAHDAIIDKMIGDEVMALFIPASGSDYRGAAVHAAEDIIRGVREGTQRESWLPLGVGVHAGTTFVGKVGTTGINDFTAIGDTVNTTARLQAEATAGEIILSEAIYQSVADSYPNLEQRTLTLRGRQEPITVRILHPAD